MYIIVHVLVVVYRLSFSSVIATRKIGESAAQCAVQICTCYTTGRQLHGSPGSEGPQKQKVGKLSFPRLPPSKFSSQKNFQIQGIPVSGIFLSHGAGTNLCFSEFSPVYRKFRAFCAPHGPCVPAQQAVCKEHR